MSVTSLTAAMYMDAADALLKQAQDTLSPEQLKDDLKFERLVILARVYAEMAVTAGQYLPSSG